MARARSFGATVSARDLCQSCARKTLEIVELLAEAHDELRSYGADRSIQARTRQLMRKIDKALGKRATVDYPDHGNFLDPNPKPNPNNDEGHTP